jgi:cytochrome c-type biogenesis protein CcmH
VADLWLPLVLLTVVAMAFVLVPVWRYRVRETEAGVAQRATRNREIFTQRQAELEREVGEGTIAAEDHQRMLAELQRAFMLDMEALQQQQDKPAAAVLPLRWLPIVLALAIPVGALLLYRSQGAAPDLALPALMQKISEATDEQAQSAALAELADSLEQRLERRPDDLQTGYMLGTLYLGMDRYAEAIGVFDKMLVEMEPTPDKATVLGQLAQARYLAAESVITPEAQDAMEQALALNPNEQAVMSLYAIDAFLKQDFVGALQYWRRQLSDLTPGSRDAEELRQRIALVESSLPAEQKAAVQGSTLTVTIDVAPLLAAKLTPDMRLFIFARSPSMPMPIVAQNVPVPAFPFTITLDNSMSMTGAQLESVPELVVGARLSVSGNAVGQSGDLETLSAPFTLNEQSEPLTLTIDSIKP